MKEVINNLIPYLVVLAQVFFIVILVLHRQKSVRTWLSKNALRLIFITSFLAMVGSLFFSLIMGFVPCDLCWYQRILMYPLVFISGFSLQKPSLATKKTIFTMAILGLVISAYHYVTQVTTASSSFCAVGATDCATMAVFKLGYISIPLMAFTAFAIIIFATLMSAKQSLVRT